MCVCPSRPAPADARVEGHGGPCVRQCAPCACQGAAQPGAAHLYTYTSRPWCREHGRSGLQTGSTSTRKPRTTTRPLSHSRTTHPRHTRARIITDTEPPTRAVPPASSSSSRSSGHRRRSSGKRGLPLSARARPRPQPCLPLPVLAASPASSAEAEAPEAHAATAGPRPLRPGVGCSLLVGQDQPQLRFGPQPCCWKLVCSVCPLRPHARWPRPSRSSPSSKPPSLSCWARWARASPAWSCATSRASSLTTRWGCVAVTGA